MMIVHITAQKYPLRLKCFFEPLEEYLYLMITG